MDDEIDIVVIQNGVPNTDLYLDTTGHLASI